jgi:peptide/nickel transport system substrate-binding protein
MKLTRRGLLGGALSLPLLQTLVQGQSGGVLRYGLSGYPQNFQPWINGGAAQGAIKLMTQRGLLSYDRAGRLQGELAETWSVDTTGAWTFRLREKTFFHNRAPVTASDVIWSLQQVAAPSLSSLMQPQLATVERFEAPDARTVRLLMKAPTATVPNWLAAREMPIIPKDSSRDNPIGAGPFRIVAQERGTSIDLAPFDGYYKPGMPKLTRIKVVAYPDDNLRLAAFQAGDVDIIDFVPVQSMESIEKSANGSLFSEFGGLQILQFNATKGPLADVRVRRAIACAIRRKEIADAAFFGRAKPVDGPPIYEGTFAYDASLANGWAYDLEKSKALLKDAGFPNGFSTAILATSAPGFEKTTAELVQQHLAQVGIQCTLNLPDQPTRNTLKNRNQFEIYSGGTVPIDVDPDSLTPSMIGSPGVEAPKTMAALAAGRAEIDPAKRAAIYKTMQAAMLEEVPFVGLVWRTEGYAVRKTVKGFYVPPGPLLRNTQWCIEQVSI